MIAKYVRPSESQSDLWCMALFQSQKIKLTKQEARLLSPIIQPQKIGQNPALT